MVKASKGRHLVPAPDYALSEFLLVGYLVGWCWHFSRHPFGLFGLIEKCGREFEIIA